jgi:glutathione S-transferase
MSVTITAFERSPDQGKGLARDMRVRWTLEEVVLPCDVRLLSFGAMKEPAHLARNPFGQIPTFEDGELVLFESGAIALHIATHHAGLLPEDGRARTRLRRSVGDLPTQAAGGDRNRHPCHMRRGSNGTDDHNHAMPLV